MVLIWKNVRMTAFGNTKKKQNVKKTHRKKRGFRQDLSHFLSLSISYSYKKKLHEFDQMENKSNGQRKQQINFELI